MKRSVVTLASLLAVRTLAGCSSSEGAASDDSAIVGGLPATDYPEAATINFMKGGAAYLCSGTVIAPKVVLTAGHCVAGGASDFMVSAGGVTSAGTSATALDYVDTTENVNFGQHDVALIFLADAITLKLYPSIATTPVASGTRLVNVGRILNNVQTDNLYEAATTVTLPFEAPFDYTSSHVIQHGDSGGPDFISGTHTIASVNSGAYDTSDVQYLARVDLVHDFIVAQIAAHGGGGGAPSAGVIPDATLAAVKQYETVTTQLNCRSGPGTTNPILTSLAAGDLLTSMTQVQPAPDGSPWLLVQPPTGAACYVSAKYEFIAPTLDQSQVPPDGRIPGTQDLAVKSGLYGSLAIVTHASTLTGSVRDGACEFTISGSLTNQNPIPLTISTGSGAQTGSLTIVDNTDVVFTAPNLASACAALLPQASSGQTLALGTPLSAVIFGFRTVHATKAFFHDGPGSPSGSKFVLAGQTVQQLSENQGGYVQVRFSDGTSPLTTGYLLESDLVDTRVAGTTL